MTHFYKVVRGRVLHNNKALNIGDFIYASPKDMEEVAGVGSVIPVNKGEVSFTFLQQNNLLHLVNADIVQVPQEQTPIITTQILTPPPSRLTQTEAPETPTPELGADTNVQTDLGVSLGIDPVAKAEATGKRNRSAASNQ